MTIWLADLAWVDGAVRERVALDVDAEGRLVAVTPGAADGQRIEGLVVPGLANVHSQAYRRGLAGMDGDTLATRFAGLLTPDDLQAIAAQLYAECLVQGFTSVAEFHELHNAPDGRPYDDPAEMGLRIVAAAAQSGIGLRLLPVLYRPVAEVPSASGRQRFVLQVEAYGRLCHDLAEYAAVGVAPHSPLSVTRDDLHAALVIADLLGPATPVHIQLAAQAGEAASCLAAHGCRPVAVLRDHAAVDARWCLLHLTHADAAECQFLAATGAVAGLCPTSAARRGEGVPPWPGLAGEGGRFGIGTGSNNSASPAEEFRWLAYLRRAVVPTKADALLACAWTGGARALARPCGTIAPGSLADLVVLDTDHPALVGRSGAALLDAWLFTGNATPVRHVMVAGRWVVQHGTHVRGAEIGAAFARTMRRLAGQL